MMRGKKGQIPILMLFLVAIILVITALFSFFGFSGDFGDNSALVSRTIAGAEFGQDYVASSAKLIVGETIMAQGDKREFMRIANGKDLGIQEAGNFFGKIRDGDFVFESTGGDVRPEIRQYVQSYKLEIKGLFSRSSYGNNEIKRNYDLCMIFRSDGSYLGDC